MEETTPYKIVYIEDDPEMIDLVSLILNRQGYQGEGHSGSKHPDSYPCDRYAGCGAKGIEH